CPRLRKSEQQKRHNRKMPHTMTGRKGSAAGAALPAFQAGVSLPGFSGGLAGHTPAGAGE
ncbi:TPA: hypothetical protein ACIGUR_004619, partial [Salmonella enterica]